MRHLQRFAEFAIGDRSHIVVRQIARVWTTSDELDIMDDLIRDAASMGNDRLPLWLAGTRPRCGRLNLRFLEPICPSYIPGRLAIEGGRIMTGTERVLAVLMRETPDRIPTFEWDIDSGFVTHTTGGGDYHDFIERFDHDAVVCGVKYRTDDLRHDRIKDEWGVTRQQGFEDYAMPVDELAPIKTMVDLESYTPPDPHDEARLENLRAFRQRYKDRRAIIFRVRDVWSGPRELMGYEHLMLQCLEDPQLVREVVRMSVDHNIGLMSRAAEDGADLVMTGDDIAYNSGPLISPALWEKLFIPEFRRFEEAVHRLGLFHWKHTDGNIKPLLPSLIEAGIDAIDPVDPLGGMDLAEIKNQWGDHIAIKGNVDCVGLLTRGTAEEVERAVKACIRSGGPGGGYACSTSNSIHSGVRPDLYQTMIDTLRKHGSYPLSL